MSGRHVAVVGAGLSGALQAMHLVEAGAGKVTLIERSRVPGRGVAYGTERPEHLLNVPALRMSAWPDRPDHFADWWGARGGDPQGFAPRLVYGDYVREQLAAADGVEIVKAEAVDVRATEAGEQVILADGRTILADVVVLAPGNLEPAVPGPIDTAALGPVWAGDPWSVSLDGLGDEDTILLIGTGLTAVDIALSLDAQGFKGRILALSRRGLAPRAHEPHEPDTEPQHGLPADGIGLIRHIRARAKRVSWRSAVHELRPITQQLWRNASQAERRRFLRHLRPWWDVHRHRIAPDVAAAIDRMQAAGQLRFAAGKIVSLAIEDGRACVAWRRRGKGETETMVAARILNCTGPEMDIVRAGEPLLDALLASGRIRPDPLRIGLDVDGDCRTLDASGTPSNTLYAVGPVTRGTFWESVAVPDIRVQTGKLARHIA